jgi:hypothetical protein
VEEEREGNIMELVLELQSLEALDTNGGGGGGGGGQSNLSLLANCHNSTLSVVACP